MIFLESPWPILFLGIVAEAVLALMLLRTGRGYLLWIMIGVAALVAVGLAVEQLVPTERKAVMQTLDAAVAAAEANDIEALLECVSPTAQQPRADARRVFSLADIKMARIYELELTINHLTSPPTAKARFRAFGQARDRHGEFPYETFSRAVTVDLRREGTRWLVFDYTIEGLRIP